VLDIGSGPAQNGHGLASSAMHHALRESLVMFCRLFLATFAVVMSAAPAFAAGKNVVLIVADDLGLQLGAYGDPNVRTPHLDRFAAASTRFTRAYCTTASCSACRSVILTGLYNHATAHYGHEHGENHFRTYDTVRSLPVMLAAAGYRTASVGKLHVAPEAVYHFDRYLKAGRDGHNPVAMAAAAHEFLAEKDARPFFLYFCPFDPHRANDRSGFGNDKARDRITPALYDPAALELPKWLPDRPEAREEWAEYCQAISRLDEGVGALLAALQSTGHAEDTLVLFLSDNGPPFPGAKTTLYEPGIHLPLVVHQPGQTQGVVSDARVNWADLTPTILEFAGVALPDKPRERLQGRSLLPILNQAHPQGWDELFASHTFHEVITYYPMRAVISGRYKYIFNIAHPLPFPFASDLYQSRTWQGVLTRGDTTYGLRSVAAYVQRPRHELYDLEADPDELRNLASDPQQAQRLAELQAKLKAWQTETRDPWVSKWTYE
jgi:N-sulfoglucosamine sulfohydrolase